MRAAAGSEWPGAGCAAAGRVRGRGDRDLTFGVTELADEIRAMKPGDGPTVLEFKSGERRRIQEAGYTILVNSGTRTAT